MKHFTFELESDKGDMPAVGLIVLQSDETMEHELRLWLSDKIRLFHTRIPNSVVISHESLQQMKSALPAATMLLPSTTDYRVIVYGCTSASTVIGEKAVTEAVQSVFPNARVTNPLSAIKAQLASLNAKNIALLTPYVPDVSAAMIANLADAGISVIMGGSFHESRDDRVARISRDSLCHALKELGKAGNIDAIVASCTNLRTHSLIDEMSTMLAIPVISSNSALAWHVQTLLNE